MVRVGLTFRQERYPATGVRMSDSSGETVVDGMAERRSGRTGRRRAAGEAARRRVWGEGILKDPRLV
jgi:hypothetical protein